MNALYDGAMTSLAPTRYLLALLAATSLVACTEDNGAGDAAAFDPVTMDASDIDPDHPPTTIELTLDSAGASLNGHFYLANGAGPHPTVILLHGLPGNEKNLDIAQAARRAGFNVLFFHYRGAWGSEGDYSFTHVIEDAVAAGDFVRSEKAVADYRVDSARVTYLGHSMGAFAALNAGARDSQAICIGAMSPPDLSIIAAAFADEAARAGFAAYMDSIGEHTEGGFGPLRGVDGASSTAEIMEMGKTMSNAGLAPEFAGRSVLLVAAKGDTAVPPDVFHYPLTAAYAADPAINFTQKMFESDHVFSSERIALSRFIISWLDAECR